MTRLEQLKSKLEETRKSIAALELEIRIETDATARRDHEAAVTKTISHEVLGGSFESTRTLPMRTAGGDVYHVVAGRNGKILAAWRVVEFRGERVGSQVFGPTAPDAVTLDIRRVYEFRNP
jgi:hypothetical protein